MSDTAGEFQNDFGGGGDELKILEAKIGGEIALLLQRGPILTEEEGDILAGDANGTLQQAARSVREKNRLEAAAIEQPGGGGAGKDGGSFEPFFESERDFAI